MYTSWSRFVVENVVLSKRWHTESTRRWFKERAEFYRKVVIKASFNHSEMFYDVYPDRIVNMVSLLSHLVKVPIKPDERLLKYAHLPYFDRYQLCCSMIKCGPERPHFRF